MVDESFGQRIKTVLEEHDYDATAATSVRQ